MSAGKKGGDKKERNMKANAYVLVADNGGRKGGRGGKEHQQTSSVMDPSDCHVNSMMGYRAPIGR